MSESLKTPIVHNVDMKYKENIEKYRRIKDILKYKLYTLSVLLFNRCKKNNCFRFLNIGDSLLGKNLNAKMYFKIKFIEKNTGHLISLADHYIQSLPLKSLNLHVEIHQKIHSQDHDWIKDLGDHYIDYTNRKICLSVSIYKYRTNSLYIDSLKKINPHETIFVPFSHKIKENGTIDILIGTYPLFVFYKR